MWLTADRPLIIGHRGASADAPENTLAAFAQALEQGADGMELDVQLSADGAPIVMHDATVDRTCDGAGRVSEMTLAELRQLTIAGDQPVPTLDDVFDLLGRRALYNVELKALGVNDGGLAATVARCVVAHNVADCVLVSSFSPFTVRSARRHLPAAVPVALLRQHRLMRPFHALLDTVADHPDFPLIDAGLMAWARRRGLRVNAWTVNDPADARRLAGLGVHGLITNTPAVLRAAISPAAEQRR